MVGERFRINLILTASACILNVLQKLYKNINFFYISQYQLFQAVNHRLVVEFFVQNSTVTAVNM